MKCTLEQLRQTKVGSTPANQKLIAEAIRKHGPQADVLTLGTVRAPQLQRDKIPALERKPSLQQKRENGLAVCVTIIRFGYKELDEDNFHAGAKPLRDGIAASLGVDDADPRVLWQYAQVIEGGRSGVAVKIDEL